MIVLNSSNHNSRSSRVQEEKIQLILVVMKLKIFQRVLVEKILIIIIRLKIIKKWDQL